MENKEILKEEEFLASTGEGTAINQTMFPAMEVFEINGKYHFPVMTLLGDVLFRLAT